MVTSLPSENTYAFNGTYSLVTVSKRLSTCLDDLLDEKPVHDQTAVLLQQCNYILFSPNEYHYFKMNFDIIIEHGILAKIGRIGLSASPRNVAFIIVDFYLLLYHNIDRYELFHIYSETNREAIKQISKLVNYILLEMLGPDFGTFDSNVVMDVFEKLILFLISHPQALEVWFEVLDQEYELVETVAHNFKIVINRNLCIKNSEWYYKLCPIYNKAILDYLHFGDSELLVQLFQLTNTCSNLMSWIVIRSNATQVLIEHLNHQKLSRESSHVYLILIESTSGPLQLLLINDLLDNLFMLAQKNIHLLKDFMEVLCYSKIDLDDRFLELFYQYCNSIEIETQTQTTLTLINNLCTNFNWNLVVFALCENYTVTADQGFNKFMLETYDPQDMELGFQHAQTLPNFPPKFQLRQQNKIIKDLHFLLNTFLSNQPEINDYLIRIFTFIDMYSKGVIAVYKGRLIYILNHVTRAYLTFTKAFQKCYEISKPLPKLITFTRKQNTVAVKVSVDILLTNMKMFKNFYQQAYLTKLARSGGHYCRRI